MWNGARPVARGRATLLTRNWHGLNDDGRKLIAVCESERTVLTVVEADFAAVKANVTPRRQHELPDDTVLLAEMVEVAPEFAPFDRTTSIVLERTHVVPGRQRHPAAGKPQRFRTIEQYRLNRRLRGDGP